MTARVSLALACVAALLTAPGAAVAAVSFEVIPGQSSISIPGTSQVSYTLKMTTDAQQEERFAVWPQVQYFNGLEPVAGNPFEGPTLAVAGKPAIGGAGTISGGVDGIPSQIVSCGLLGPGRHGAFAGGFGLGTVFVTLPPSSETTLTYRFTPAPQAPWPSTRYAPSFVASPNLIASSTLPATLTTPSPEPTVTGLSGVQIRFRTKPRSLNLGGPFRFAPPIPKGKQIKILGNTDPKLRRQKVRLMYAGPKDKKPKLLAKVRTGRKGKFRYRGWEPDKKGDYELWVEYRSQRDHLASDFTCSRLLEVVPRKKR